MTSRERRANQRRRGHAWSFCAAALIAAGCGGDGPGDAGGRDAATTDGAVMDAAAADGGQRDGAAPDGGGPVIATHGRYRYESYYLFQAAPPNRPPEVEGGGSYSWGGYGANSGYVDRSSGWTWDHVGGDYVDRDGVRQGANSWFSFEADMVSGCSAESDYEVDVTAALQFVQGQHRWSAFLLRAAGYFAMAGKFSDSPPTMDVTYADGSSETQEVYYATTMQHSDAYEVLPRTSLEESFSFPVAIEFARPDRPVQHATLHLHITKHCTGASTTVSGFVIDPPVNDEPVQQGLAASLGPLDEGAPEHGAVIGAQRYMDGTTIDDFLVPFSSHTSNFNSEDAFDPALYGRGPSDRTLLPHASADTGRWVSGSRTREPTLVASDYEGEGFEPLAPGLGALRWHMPAHEGLIAGGHGTDVGGPGGLGANAKIYMPEPLFGRLDHIFVRYYVRLATPYVTPQSARLQMRTSRGIQWSGWHGKFGIMPGFVTWYGGNSGSSGGGNGWQMRMSWHDCDAELGGGDENSLGLGLHTYDFLDNAPEGHRYGATDTPRLTQMGQRGGLGAQIYGGQWTMIEVEMKLNSVMEESPGYLEDGELRVWFDGRLAFERTGMVVRSLPIITPGYNVSATRPIRELGIAELWHNWYHGGIEANSLDRVIFTTGLVWSHEYIGPMRMAE